MSLAFDQNVMRKASNNISVDLKSRIKFLAATVLPEIFQNDSNLNQLSPLYYIR